MYGQQNIKNNLVFACDIFRCVNCSSTYTLRRTNSS